MKNFIFISACLLSLIVNAQVPPGSEVQDIYDDFVLDSIQFIND